MWSLLKSMHQVQLDIRQTIVIAILVLYFGKYLTGKIRFLREYNIPEAVSGGLIASLIFGIIYSLFRVQVDFNLDIRDVLLVVFFTTIGLSAKLNMLLKGGKPLLILLGIAIVYIFLQNLAGVSVARILGIELPIGILAGSVSLSGGHGTTIAWAPIFQRYGLENASEIGIASATFGLVLGGVIGGPIARFLIKRHKLKSEDATAELSIGIREDQTGVQINYNTMLNSVFVIGLAIGLGLQINLITDALGLKLPLFVACLFAGIILTNTIPHWFKHLAWPTDTPSLALIADVSLGLFLAISLMSLQLWTLAGVAGPVTMILLVQFMMIILYAIFVVFPLMGHNYNGAVIAAGYAGLALGATPTAIANMTAVTERFGASPQAFIILPLVGAFFVDIVNAFVIQNFLNWVT